MVFLGRDIQVVLTLPLPFRLFFSGKYLSSQSATYTYYYSFPFFSRFKQCLVEWRRAGLRSSMINAIKYISSLPCIFLLYWMAASTGDDGHDNYGPFSIGLTIRHLWILFSLINSIISLYWDLVMDWGWFSPASISSWCILPRKLLLGPPPLYLIAMLLNTIGRFMWLLRIVLVGLIFASKERSSGMTPSGETIFMMMFIEVLRRCLWLPFRMEHQLRLQAEDLTLNFPTYDSIPLY